MTLLAVAATERAETREIVLTTHEQWVLTVKFGLYQQKRSFTIGSKDGDSSVVLLLVR